MYIDLLASHPSVKAADEKLAAALAGLLGLPQHVPQPAPTLAPAHTTLALLLTKVEATIANVCDLTWERSRDSSVVWFQPLQPQLHLKPSHAH